MRDTKSSPNERGPTDVLWSETNDNRSFRSERPGYRRRPSNNYCGSVLGSRSLKFVVPERCHVVTENYEINSRNPSIVDVKLTKKICQETHGWD